MKVVVETGEILKPKFCTLIGSPFVLVVAPMMPEPLVPHCAAVRYLVSPHLVSSGESIVAIELKPSKATGRTGSKRSVRSAAST